jgi:two-component system NarL family sensor kinase
MSASVTILQPEPSPSVARRPPLRVVPDERRRLREDVHDRLGPLLAGIGLGLGALDPMIERDPEAARRHVRELRAQMRDAIAEVQRIIDGLGPLALETDDLVGALTRFARRGGGGAEIRVHAPEPLDELPGTVGAAAYAVALEAIANAVRHAGAGRVDVHLRRLPTALELTVTDDGHGFAGATTHGVGLRSMRARAQRLGGSFAIEPHHAGGTRVRTQLPLGHR